MDQNLPAGSRECRCSSSSLCFSLSGRVHLCLKSIFHHLVTFHSLLTHCLCHSPSWLLLISSLRLCVFPKLHFSFLFFSFLTNDRNPGLISSRRCTRSPSQPRVQAACHSGSSLQSEKRPFVLNILESKYCKTQQAAKHWFLRNQTTSNFLTIKYCGRIRMEPTIANTSSSPEHSSTPPRCAEIPCTANIFFVS